MLNIAALNGRLTAEPELRHTSNDVPVTSFTLAVDRGYVKAGQERQCDFIDIVCWRQTAEFVAKYFRKGQLVAIEGSIQTRNYTDRDGNKRKATEIVANNVSFAEGKKSQQPTDGADENRRNAEQADVPISVSQGNDNDFVEIDGDEDLPF